MGVPQTLPVYLHYPEIEQLIEFDYKGKHIGFAGLFHTGIQLRKQQFDKSYLLTNSFSSALLFPLRISPNELVMPDSAQLAPDGKGLSGE